MEKIKQKKIFRVKGMHCPSCVILVERKFSEIKGVKRAKVSLKKETAAIEYEGEAPRVSDLNHLFRKDGYTFNEYSQEKSEEFGKKNVLKVVIISLIIISLFYLLNRLGLGGLVNVQSQSSLPTFFAFGLLAGLTSCAALIGGIILSLSKQWLSLYGRNDTTLQKLQPHFMFNAGRLISYAVLGGVLGAIGSQLQLSLTFTSILVMAVSVIMLLLGLQMLGVRALRGFQISLPKKISGNITNEKKFKGRFLPLLMGAATFFLPCGFTITAQGMALLSGSPFQGALIMLFFALGTTLPLIVIGLAGVKFFGKPRLAKKFLKVAGVLILFFALFNINSQFNVMGWPSFSNLALGANIQGQNEGFPPIVNGQQVIKMKASAYGYSPNYFKVKVGVPVRWEITDIGSSGCTNAVISRSFFNGQIDLTPGQTSVKEFTPEKEGKYKFSCWMGMISGTIEVADKNGSTATSNTNDDQIIPSGAEGTCPGTGSCGGNCGGGCGCGSR